MDTKIEIKQEDCFPGDMDLQTKREFFHKVITVKSHSSSVLPDDNGCDMAIKTEIKSETSFTERDCFVKHFVKEIEFEAVTCRNTCKTVSETKIEEQALDSDFGLEKETEFLTKDPVMKAKNNDSDHEMDDKIEIKEEPWWLERETSAACDNIKDEDFPPVISSSLYKEGVSTYTSDLTTEELENDERFNMNTDSPECESDRRCGGIKSHQCNICNKDFSALSKLKAHKLIHEGIKPHKCNICNKAFTESSNLKRHKLIHEGIKSHKCNICNKAFTYLHHLKEHKLIHEGIKPHKCDICNKAFTQLSGLKKHILIHEGVNSHKCNICYKRFTQLSDLKTHKLIHGGIKPHKCNICNKAAFALLSDLKRHKRIHEGIKPYQCSMCNKAFTELSNLKTHKLIHEGLKPHKCDICNKAFTQLSNLKSHKLIHKDIKPHKCDVCSKGFTQLSTLKTHKSVHECNAV